MDYDTDEPLLRPHRAGRRIPDGGQVAGQAQQCFAIYGGLGHRLPLGARDLLLDVADTL